MVYQEQYFLAISISLIIRSQAIYFILFRKDFENWAKIGGKVKRFNKDLLYLYTIY